MPADDVKNAITRERILAQTLAQELPGMNWEQLAAKVVTIAQEHGPEIAMGAVRIALTIAGAL